MPAPTNIFFNIVGLLTGANGEDDHPFLQLIGKAARVWGSRTLPLRNMRNERDPPVLTPR